LLATFTREFVKDELIRLVRDIARNNQTTIETQKSLFFEYGFDSLDLLDFTFNIEEIFGVKIGSSELRGKAKETMKEDDFFDDQGNISPLALEELKRNIPEIPPEKIAYGLRPEDIPKLLNIDLFIRLVWEKLTEKES
jgi:acyl carrier protein